jgi:hypothetical protein
MNKKKNLEALPSLDTCVNYLLNLSTQNGTRQFFARSGMSPIDLIATPEMFFENFFL